MLHAQAAVGARCEAAGLLDLARCRRRVGCCRGGIGREGLPERLRLLRHLLGGLRAVLSGYAPRAGHRTRVAAPWLEVLGQQLDKVGGKQADHATVALESPHPPRAIAGVEAFDQVSLYEAQVAFGLVQGQRTAARVVLVPLTSPPHEYTALHQHGKRIGRPAAAGAMASESVGRSGGRMLATT
jgi:hypothetical protein